MNIKATSQHITNQLSQTSRSPLTFLPGHIFQGKITKLFPNHLASLSINGMHLTARLEASLTVGGRYWFEVQEGSGVPRLKVIENSGKQSTELTTGVNQQMIRKLGLPQSKAMEALLLHLSTNQLTLPKATLKDAAQLLTSLNRYDREAIEVVQTMIQKKLPLTKDTANALLSLQKEPMLHQQLQQLMHATEQSAQRLEPTVQQLQSALKAFFNQSQWQESRSPVQHLLSQLTPSSSTEGERQAATSLLVKMGVMNPNEDVQSFLARVHQAATAPENQPVVKQLLPQATVHSLTQLEPQVALERMMNAIAIPAGKDGSIQLNQLLQLVQPSLKAADLEGVLLKISSQPLTNDERIQLETTLNQSVQPKQIEGMRSPLSSLQQIISLLGYDHENEMFKHLQNPNRSDFIHTDRLKGILMQLQNELPEGLKEKVGEVVQRITGSQLMAVEQQGPLHQVLLQLPLALGSFQTDLTVQWEGRRQSNGQLDPNHCRILFYLELENLNEMIVDMQIQNRVISINVFNEYDKPTSLISLLLPSLKATLEQKDYKLNVFGWKKITDYEQPSHKPSNEQVYNKRVDYRGVDIRI
ncbi:hypothetical protein AB3N04_18455 [Alkalihalophilus sp. As8PL]|uniref:Flagellar hook-length control protein FliK n=1 Tax=Alkalihalophilus sp. As8PL TaxID=3237103 RepID=A0AB39BS66_9BACI